MRCAVHIRPAVLPAPDGLLSAAASGRDGPGRADPSPAEAPRQQEVRELPGAAIRLWDTPNGSTPRCSVPQRRLSVQHLKGKRRWARQRQPAHRPANPFTRIALTLRAVCFALAVCLASIGQNEAEMFSLLSAKLPFPPLATTFLLRRWHNRLLIRVLLLCRTASVRRDMHAGN